MTADEMTKAVENILRATQPQIERAALDATQLCFDAVQAALDARAKDRIAGVLSGDVTGPPSNALTAREKLIIGAVMYTVITKIQASTLALGLAIKSGGVT